MPPHERPRGLDVLRSDVALQLDEHLEEHIICLTVLGAFYITVHR